MFGIEIKFPDGRLQRARSKDTHLLIGKDPSCKIYLDAWQVDQRHAELFVSNDRVFVRDLNSTTGILVNGKRVDGVGPIGPDDVIAVAKYEIRARWRHDADQKPVARQDLSPLPSNENPSFLTAESTLQTSSVKRPALILPALIEQGESVVLLRNEMFRLRKVLQSQLVDAFGIRRVDVHRMQDEELRKLTEKIISDLIERLPWGSWSPCWPMPPSPKSW